MATKTPNFGLYQHTVLPLFFFTLLQLLNQLKYQFLRVVALVWLGVVGCVFSLHATHVVGGEISYVDLGNNTYRVTLKVFRDCGPTNTNGTGFDEVASVGVYNSANGVVLDVLMMSLFSATVNYVPVELENPCFVLPPNVCVEQAIYTQDVVLPPTEAGYTLSYQRCCRNPSIINLNMPEVQGATFTTTIPGTGLLGNQHNSSARFNQLPPVALCWNAEFMFDHSATDPDGDSLAYHLCTPFLGGTPDAPAPSPPSSPPYTPVAWASGFNASYPIASDPAFTIDPVTGFMSGTANQLGQFVIGVCVSEYRNGVLINTSNRDFQFNVTVCDPNIIAAGPGDFSFCIGETITFENNSINGTYYHWDFGVEGIDTDTSSLETPSYTYNQNGVYTVMLTVNAGWPCADTAYSTVTSMNVLQPEIIMNGYSCINGSDFYDFSSVTNGGNEIEYEWDFGPGAIPQFSSLANPGNVKMNPESSSMMVSLTVHEVGHCSEVDQMEIPNPPDVIASILPQDSFCDGYFYQFQSQPTPAQTYQWDFGLPGDADVSGLPNPGFLFPDTGHYQVRLIVNAPFTCPDTTSMNFAIYGLLQPSFPEQLPMCLDVNEFDFQGTGASTPAATYTWNFGEAANISTSHLQNPQNISFSESGYHTVSLTIEENGCVRTYEDEVWVPANMIADFHIGNNEGCPELNTSLVAVVQADSPLTYQWDLGDGTTANSAAVAHTYTQTGYYDITVTVETTTGCVERMTKVFDNAVFVYPVPMASFSVEPQRVSILEPHIEVFDASVGATSYYYSISDGSYYTAADFEHTFKEGGKQYITQQVMNDYGCKDEVAGEVIVEGYTFYAPNAFTPNNDGVNDGWKPQMTGVSEYQLQIFDRWGELVHESHNPETPWLGDYQGKGYYVQNGVYPYVIHFRDMLNHPYELNGHIVLSR